MKAAGRALVAALLVAFGAFGLLWLIVLALEAWRHFP